MDKKKKEKNKQNKTKQDPTTCSLQALRTHSLQVKRWQKAIFANGNQKRAEVAMLLFDKIDFKSKKTKKIIHNDKRVNLLRGYSHCKYICTQPTNVREPKYRKPVLPELKGEMDSNTIIVGNFNTHF